MKKDCRESFIFYKSFQNAIDQTEESDQLIIYRAISNYALNREEPELTGIPNLAWQLIKPQLDANWKRYANGCKGAEHGIKGGNPNFQKGVRNPYYTNKDNPNDKGEITLKITPSTTPNKNKNNNRNNNLTKKESRKKKSATDSFHDRQQDFKNELIPCIEQYNKEMIRAFFDYWGEPDKSGRMRFELERTWDLSHRLRTWERRQYEKR